MGNGSKIHLSDREFFVFLKFRNSFLSEHGEKEPFKLIDLDLGYGADFDLFIKLMTAYGASKTALIKLCDLYGYKFWGTDVNEVNCFFVLKSQLK